LTNPPEEAPNRAVQVGRIRAAALPGRRAVTTFRSSLHPLLPDQVPRQYERRIVLCVKVWCDMSRRVVLKLAAAPREPGNDGCQVVRIDGLWHVDLKPSQQRQVCVVLLDERG
jgi:hypothetical protein